MKIFSLRRARLNHIMAACKDVTVLAEQWPYIGHIGAVYKYCGRIVVEWPLAFSQFPEIASLAY